MPEQSRRTERVNELLRNEISELIRRQLKDPRLAGMVTVTEVTTAPDLSSARVFVSVMGSDEEKQASLQTLRRAAGFFHRKLLRLRMRRVPELDFRLDTSLERGDRVLGLLRELEQDRRPPSEGSAEVEAGGSES